MVYGKSTFSAHCVEKVEYKRASTTCKASLLVYFFHISKWLFLCLSNIRIWNLLFISVFKLFHMLYSSSSLFVRISFHWKRCFFFIFLYFLTNSTECCSLWNGLENLFWVISCKLGIHVYYYKLKRSFIRKYDSKFVFTFSLRYFSRSTPRTKNCRWTFCVEIKGPISWCQFLLHKWIDLS
jgi:hypothetical protein